MTPLIVIRPQPGCDATVAKARGMGLAAQGFPLFSIEPIEWQIPDLVFDALLIGSSNAIRHGGGLLDKLHPLPVYAVGEASAQAAREAGFRIAATGGGHLQAVIDRIAAPAKLLRLCGRERVALTPPPGISVAEIEVYAAVPQSPPPELADMLAQGAVVMLHSAEAARHFASLNLPREAVTLACISARTAAAAGHGWRAVQSASTPSDAALLALAAAMCQEAADLH